MLLNHYLLTNRERKFFDIAKSVSKTSDFHGPHIGCVVTYNKILLSAASNSEKTHPLQKNYNKFRGFNVDISINKLHAEVHALSLLINENIDWTKVSIYIYRSHKSGFPAISKPCKGCFNLIKDLGIKYIYFIDEKGQYCKYETLELIDTY